MRARSGRRVAICLAVGVSFWSLLAAAQSPHSDDGRIPPALDLAQAERIFLERGLDLLIAQYGAEGAEGDARAAGAHPNPGLDFGVLYTPNVNRDVLYSGLGAGPSPSVHGSLWGFDVGITDNSAIADQLSGKRSLRIEAASKALAAAKLNVGEIRRLGVGQVRQAYVGAVMAKLNVEAAKDSLETYNQQLALNQKRYEAGAIGGLDLSRVTQAQLEALQTLDQAQAGEKQALAALFLLLGVREAAPAITLTSSIDYANLPKLAGTDAGSLNRQAVANRPDFKIAAASLEQSEVLVRQAKRARVPDLALSLGYSEQCSGTSCASPPVVNAGVQGNVPLFYQQQGEITRAEANQRIASRNVEKVKALILSDVTQAFAAYLAATSQVERMQAKLLEQAKVSRDLAQRMYQRGAASLIDFMDAQRAFVASRLEYHQDLANYWDAVYQLEQATATVLR